MSFLLIGIYVPVVNNLIGLAAVPFTQLLLVLVVTMLAMLLVED